VSNEFAVVDPDDVEREPFPESGTLHRKLTAALGCTETRVDTVTLAPGEATGPHHHEQQEEVSSPSTAGASGSRARTARLRPAASCGSAPTPCGASATSPTRTSGG